MQYILTEEEYRALREKATRASKFPSDKALQELCTKIADTMPIKRRWDPKGEPTPWVCKLSKNEDMRDANMGYCDQCPVQDICPHPYKSWSK